MTSDLLSAAGNRTKTPFDYIIVGSGAGGGPMAARLALAGKRVLLIEAGRDPATQRSRDFPNADPGEVHDVPGYHAAATEDKEMSWQFSVRHYCDDARQKLDRKYNRLGSAVDEIPYPSDPRFLDSTEAGRVKGGIFYPRSASLGGCTSHHAMIVVAPNDKDWDYIANLTGDDSWRASQMRGYFTKLEKCLYLDTYSNALRKVLGVAYYLWRGIVFLLSPRSVLDEGGHGRDGWQPTSFLDPELIQGIAKSDRSFFRILAKTALSVLHRDRKLIALLKRALFRFRLVAHIDPNDQNTRRVSPEGIFLIPTAIGGGAKETNAKAMVGCRIGVREFLVETAEKHPDRLVIATGYHVTRVLFEKKRKQAPSAIGVEAAPGDHLYQASPIQEAPPEKRVQFFTRGDVILSGGAFNTPQILMLSGIGDREQLGGVSEPGIEGLRGPKGDLVAPVVHLPGVGRNLQDRYEVAVITELDRELEILKGVTFMPGDPDDPARKQWKTDQTGLYAGNGGTVAILKRSTALSDDEPEPDLFIFGVPAAFRGYYWGWSRELFRRGMAEAAIERKLWSWVILKAYTQNKDGAVRLRTDSPFDQPEICFDSFNESEQLVAGQLALERAKLAEAGRPETEDLLDRLEANGRVLANSRADLAALLDAVKTVRAINRCNREQFKNELQPGNEIPDDSPELEEWIKTQAWGHHASCTCRMGADQWREDPASLTDPMAVVDSRFRVHGVQNLRVVDASVFPRIPGYFILAPILMLSEKAADVLLEDALEAVYPHELRQAEMAAIAKRRQIARVDAETGTVGLALSGGGIRSATFSLGVLQTIAERGRLRNVDYLSTVSGGGFTGSFLGRLFTRRSTAAATDPVGRVEDIVKNPRSAPLWWLRSQANYLLGAGALDVRQNLALYFRNLFTVHLVIGALLFAIFGLLRGLGAYEPAFLGSRSIRIGQTDVLLSHWWWLPIGAFLFGVLPGALGYWLAPRVKSPYPYPLYSFVAWLVLLAACVVILTLPGGVPLAIGGLVILAVTWLWEETARWGYSPKTGEQGTVVRNRLTRSLGEALVLFVAAVGWVALDTLAGYAANKGVASTLTLVLAALSPFLPLLRKLAEIAHRPAPKNSGQSGGAKKESGSGMSMAVSLLGILLAVFLLFMLDLFAHKLFAHDATWGWYAVGIAFFFSAAIGQALEFVNQSSLHASYAARLTRTFQGASNDARVYSSTTNRSHDVQLAHPEDDLPFDKYHPERRGGPLHLINVCVNETIDSASQREVRERKGLPMCLGPEGVSVGRRYHALWDSPDDLTRRQRFRVAMEGRHRITPVALRALPAPNDPEAFHVFGTRQGGLAPVENLSLGAWTAISGAAFSTGIGRQTNWRLALFTGLVNLRLGYWWNSGISSGDRPGRFPQSLWQRLKHLPGSIFRLQSLLASEWRALFPGASRRFWYLSDGGHFENTGLYELLRRRVEFIICTDAGADPRYGWDDMANLARQARLDFGAEILWLSPADVAAPAVPEWIVDWIDPKGLSEFRGIKCDGNSTAALARVHYASGTPADSWILLLKPCLTDAAPFDIRNYQSNHSEFPQQPTSDQFFDDAQWESYRALGQWIARGVLRGKEADGG